jgi:hypothetical protein
VKGETLLFILTNEKFFKIISCLPLSLLRGLQDPFFLFVYLLNETLSWSDLEVEDKIVVSKYKDRVDIIERYHEREEI